MKKIMTLADLHNYFSSIGKDQKFSYKDNNKSIIVQIDGKLNFAKTDDTRGLFPVNLQLASIGDNLNGSRITESAMKKALSSTKYRPILGYIYTDNNGEPQFMGHNMHMEDDEIVYDEIPIGVISEEATLSYDEEYKKDYACSKGYIFEEYTKAKEILERDEKCDVSVEISVLELSYSVKDNVLILDDFFFNGVSILGFDENSGEKVRPAMPGSKITIENFSKGIVKESDAIEVLSKIKDVLADFSIDKKSGKEETEVENLEKFEEVAETEEVTVTEESTEEEATAENTEDAADVTPETETVTEEMSAEGESSEGETVEETSEEEVSDLDSTEEDISNVDIAEFSVTVNGETKTFSLSLNDKINALYSLVNETYGELDDDYYDVVVFEDTKTVEMHGWFRGKSYKQSYKTKKDEFSLIGDRVPISAVWMTDDEKAAFEKMKADFSVISEKLQKYEDEPKKMEILEHQKYNYVSDSKEFVELQADHFDMSVEEIEKKADEILLSYAENGKLKFSNKENEKESKIKSISFGTPKTKTGRYGNLFSK